MRKRSLISMLCGGAIIAAMTFTSAIGAELRIDFGDHENSGSPVQDGWNGFAITSDNTATSHSYGAINVTLADTGQPVLADRLRGGPVAIPTDITLSDMLRDFLIADNNNAGQGLNVLVEGLTPNYTYQGRIWSHDDGVIALPYTFIADWTANGTLIADDYNSGGPAPTTDNQKSFAFEIDTNASGEILFQALRTPESDGSAGVINGLYLEDAGETLLQIDFGDHESSGNPVQDGWSGFAITGNDSATMHTYGAIDVTVSDTGQPSLQDRLRSGPVDGNSISLSDMLRDFAFGDNNNPGEGLSLLVEGLVPNQLYEGQIWSHDDGVIGIPDVTFIADWTANGTLIADDYNNGGPAPMSDDEKSFTFQIGADPEGKILFQALRTPESNGSSGVINGLYLNAVPEPATGIMLLIGALAITCLRGRRK